MRCLHLDTGCRISLLLLYFPLTSLLVSVNLPNSIPVLFLLFFLFLPCQTSDTSIVMTVDVSSTIKGLRLILCNGLAWVPKVKRYVVLVYLSNRSRHAASNTSWLTCKIAKIERKKVMFINLALRNEIVARESISPFHSGGGLSKRYSFVSPPHWEGGLAPRKSHVCAFFLLVRAEI